MIIFILAAVLSGCAILEPPEKKRLLADPNLPSDVRSAILAGKIRVGMTKDQVTAAWGYHCWYCRGTRHSSWGDTWEYNPFGSGSYGVGSGTYLFFDASGRLRGWSD